MNYTSFGTPSTRPDLQFTPGPYAAPTGAGQFEGVPQYQQHFYNEVHQRQLMFMDQMNQMQQMMFLQQKNLEEHQRQIEERYQAGMEETQSRLQSLEISMVKSSRLSGDITSDSSDRKPVSRRHSIFIGKAVKEYDAETVEKSLDRFKFDQKFSGKKSEDIDAFLRSFERAVQSKPPDFWVFLLDRQLENQAARVFQSEFPDLCTAEYKLARSFLVKRYRSMRNVHNTNKSMLQIRQLGSATVYFNHMDSLMYKLSDLSYEERYKALIVSMAVAGLKPVISKKLLEDSSKLKPDYTLEQLREDVLSIESALGDSDNNNAGKSSARPNLATVIDASKANQTYEVYLANLKSQNKPVDKPGPRPAYEHAEYYRVDGNSCRYCKSLDHNTALCEKLYRRENNGKAMPKQLIEGNRRILEAKSE